MLEINELSTWKRLWLLMTSVWVCVILMGVLVSNSVKTLNDIAIFLIVALVPPTLIYLSILTVRKITIDMKEEKEKSNQATNVRKPPQQ